MHAYFPWEHKKFPLSTDVTALSSDIQSDNHSVEIHSYGSSELRNTHNDNIVS